MLMVRSFSACARSKGGGMVVTFLSTSLSGPFPPQPDMSTTAFTDWCGTRWFLYTALYTQRPP